MIDKNEDIKPMSRETAFVILAITVCLVAFAIYGLMPDKAGDIVIPNQDRVSGNYLQNYSPILELNKTDENGQPAWRKLVFGDSSTSTDNSATTNLTEGIARDMVTLNALASQDSSVDSDVYMNAIADGAANSIQIRDVGQINISSDISRAALKNYGNQASTIFALLFGNQQKEIEDVNKYLSSGNKNDLENVKNLQIVINTYCDAFKKYEAPRNIAPLHRRLLENCYLYSDILSALANTDTDATKSLVAISVYKKMYESHIALLKDFSNFFITNNIVFGVNDKGKIFNNQTQ